MATRLLRQAWHVVIIFNHYIDFIVVTNIIFLVASDRVFFENLHSLFAYFLGSFSSVLVGKGLCSCALFLSALDSGLS